MCFLISDEAFSSFMRVFTEKSDARQTAASVGGRGINISLRSIVIG